MKASSLVLTVGMIFLAVLNYTNTASGAKPTTSKLSKGMTIHPFTQLINKKADSNKPILQTTLKKPDRLADQNNHIRSIPVIKQYVKKPGKRLSSRVK